MARRSRARMAEPHPKFAMAADLTSRQAFLPATSLDAGLAGWRSVSTGGFRFGRGLS